MAPEFRPDAPAPTSDCSNSTTFAPASARNAAADVPMIPPPITATSNTTEI
jgi:hypothetical protein